MSNLKIFLSAFRGQEIFFFQRGNVIYDFNLMNLLDWRLYAISDNIFAISRNLEECTSVSILRAYIFDKTEN